MKNILEKTVSIFLSLAISIAMLVPMGNFAYEKAYALDAGDITTWSVSAIGKNIIAKGTSYALSFEKNDDKFVLCVPEDIVQKGRGTISITAPSTYEGEFSVTYTTFNEQDVVRTETTVSSSNGTARQSTTSQQHYSEVRQMYNRLKRLYEQGRITQEQLRKAVDYGWITAEEYETIINPSEKGLAE